MAIPCPPQGKGSIFSSLGNSDAHKLTWGTYWKGWVMDYVPFVLVSVFLGFFGIDHLLLRSPSTAFFKVFVNFAAFGLWYFYDIIQLQFDKDNVIKYGLTTPFGPKGLGYKFFNVSAGEKKENPEWTKHLLEKESSSIGPGWRYVLFILLGLMPIGLGELFGGDYKGGLLRLIFAFAWFIFIPWEIYHRFKSTVDEPFTKGIARPYIISWILGNEYGPPSGLVKGDLATQITEDTSIFSQLTSLFGIAFQIAEPVVGPAATSVQIAADSVAGIATATSKAIETAGSVAGAAGGLAATVGQIATQVPAKMSSAMDPSQVARMAGPSSPPMNANNDPRAPPTDITMPTGKQSGGGFLPVGPSSWDTTLVGLLGALVVGGFGLTFLRKRNQPKRSDDYPEDTYAASDDAPPNPGTI